MFTQKEGLGIDYMRCYTPSSGEPLGRGVQVNPKYGVLFIFSLFCEPINLEYVRVCVIHRIYQAEYVIRIRVAVTGIREYVFNTQGCNAPSTGEQPEERARGWSPPEEKGTV